MDSRHNEPIAPNCLQRDFSASAPDRVWVGDTTYLPVIGGFILLVAIIDLFSCKVVGWSLGDRPDAELSGEALHPRAGETQPRARLIFRRAAFRFSATAAASALRTLAQVLSEQIHLPVVDWARPTR